MTAYSSAKSGLSPVIPSLGALRPLGLDSVRITGGFWAARQEVNARATIDHIGRRLESEGWLPNFDLAARGALPAGRRGREFSDSEIYKYLEALAWEIGRDADPALEARFREVVARVRAAQADDGYLNTAFGRSGQPPRWSDLEWGHELYCLGHLFQAAVARLRTRPHADDELVSVARRAADLVCSTFGPDGLAGICGHPEIEVGLAELGRATNTPAYIEQARLFVDRRGHGSLADIEWGRSYFQDDVPVREASVLRGHAVRANYLSAAAVDVATETKDDELLDALRTQWEATVARRTYVTGGQGAHHQDEAFGDDWELPPDRAYSETCASIGSIMFAWRLLLADGDPRYADLIERTLYNVVATSPSADGRSFFYANTLHQRTAGQPLDPVETSLRVRSSQRAPWFGVSCCLPNVARTLASLAGYVATATADGIQIHQYAPARIETTLDDGSPVVLDVDTRYPDDGLVRVSVGVDASSPWTLSLRVPAWADRASFRLVAADGTVEDVRVDGPRAELRRAFTSGDVVELALDVAPRVTWPDPRIDAVRGCVAIERGPVVLAVESIDVAAAGGGSTVEVAVDLLHEPADRDGRVGVRLVPDAAPMRSWPYATQPPAESDAGIDVDLVAYHSWAERGPSTMRVWIPVLGSDPDVERRVQP